MCGDVSVSAEAPPCKSLVSMIRLQTAKGDARVQFSPVQPTTGTQSHGANVLLGTATKLLLDALMLLRTAAGGGPEAAA